MGPTSHHPFEPQTVGIRAHNLASLGALRAQMHTCWYPGSKGTKGGKIPTQTVCGSKGWWLVGPIQEYLAHKKPPPPLGPP